MLNPVVVIPTHKVQDDLYAKISIAHLRKYLSNYRIVLAIPEGLAWSINGIDTEIFPADCFGSITNYNRFQLSLQFYERFSSHSHILIYHFDSLVFKDKLLDWCKCDYDYIGASWYPNLIKKYVNLEWPFAAVGCGNGGFSLRKTSAFINHLKKRKPVVLEVLSKIIQGDIRVAKMLWRYRKHLNVANYKQHESLNEDVYFGVFAPLLDNSFRVAPPDVGDLFAFEYDPEFLFKKNGEILPFGCHAWYRFPDALAFWRPYLIA
jgi:hypothetical protein